MQDAILTPRDAAFVSAHSPACRGCAHALSKDMPTVFVISEDWTLRTAARAELLELGIDALGFESADQAAQAAAAGSLPDAVVLDTAHARLDHPAIASWTRRAGLLLITSGIAPAPEAPAGAVVLRRPVRVGEIVAQVRHILEGQLA